jgi:hypothetical protein
MRAHRIVLVATWILVSLLAVVGFANFSVSDPTTTPETAAIEYAPDLGVDAGAASAMAFAYRSGAGVIEAEVVVVATTVAEAQTDEAPTSRSNATYELSSVLNESTVRELAAAVFEPSDVSRAIRSAWCASNFDPRYQDADSGAAGLFQLTPEQWSTHAQPAGQASREITDPGASAAVAAWIVYQTDGSWSSLACTG